MTPTEELDLEVQRILQNRKYREMDIPESTVRDILEKALEETGKMKDARKQAKRKLHNIVATYLGDPDYVKESNAISALFAGQLSPGQEKEYCRSILSTHASSRERLPYMDRFYPAIFSITGIPRVVQDLACALHPFSIPWMQLPVDIHYHAYDIHQPRVDLINQYFQARGLQPLAENRDVLIHPPDLICDVAFLFKELHRMEKRERGCSRQLCQQLHCRWLVVTLPATSLTGEHDLRTYHRQMVLDTVKGFPWKLVEAEVGNEMIFCLELHSETTVHNQIPML